MNKLQKLLKLRGISDKDLADHISPGYHMVQKNIKGTYSTRHVQEAIASYLRLTWGQAFGPASSNYLHQLILQEINKLGKHIGQRKEAELKAIYIDTPVSEP